MQTSYAVSRDMLSELQRKLVLKSTKPFSGLHHLSYPNHKYVFIATTIVDDANLLGLGPNSNSSESLPAVKLKFLAFTIFLIKSSRFSKTVIVQA